MATEWLSGTVNVLSSPPWKELGLEALRFCALDKISSNIAENALLARLSYSVERLKTNECITGTAKPN